MSRHVSIRRGLFSTFGGLVLLSAAFAAAAAAAGVASRQVPAREASVGFRPVNSPYFSLAAAASLVGRWGTISSLKRSAKHNRTVGGAANSFHLIGRAIDVVRRPGVRHRDIEAALLRSGLQLLESIDEGDHSHFAFAPGASPSRPTARTPNVPAARLIQARGGGLLADELAGVLIEPR